MPDLQEVFRMATQKVRPDVGFVDRQLGRQRKRARNRKLGGLGLAAVIGVMAVLVVMRAAQDDGAATRPGGGPTVGDASPSAQPIPSALPGGRVEPGRYVFSSYDVSLDPLDSSYRISIDVADGYTGLAGGAVVKLGTDRTGVGIVANLGGVYTDACHWEGTLVYRSAISSTDELAAALASQEGLRVSAPTGVALDGFAGTYMERRVPAGTDLAGCDGGELRTALYPDGGTSVPSPGDRVLLWILDIEGVPLLIGATLEAGTSAQVRAELVQMVESVRIDPR
jgi:hypothetical protein